MKIVMITRSTLYTVPGGDTIQIMQTARYLNELGLTVDIKLTNEQINYDDYDLLHFFSIIRPADILYHAKKSTGPYVVSTILVDYSEYDKHYRKGIGRIFSSFPGDTIEYVKTVARWLLGKDILASLDYLWKGQRQSILQILKGAAMILPNSQSELGRIIKRYGYAPRCSIIPNGIDPALFTYNPDIKKDSNLVLCVARIEGIKNQLNLIKALNNTKFRLLLIGAYVPNQYNYYKECRTVAAANVEFIDHLPQLELLNYYSEAKVHVLPSWFETTGLSTLEAAAMGCNVVITDKGDTRCYFEDYVVYCDPVSHQSILQAIEKASHTPANAQLQQKILEQYTWQQAAMQTLKAYQTVITHHPETVVNG